MTDDHDDAPLGIDALDAIQAPSDEDIAEMERQAAAAREERHRQGDLYARGAEITADHRPKRFNTVSLRDWMHVVRSAGVDSVVPAEHIGSVDPMLPMRLMDECASEDEAATFRALSERLGEAMERYQGRAVVRWDLCTSGGTKYVMGSGCSPFDNERIATALRGAVKTTDGNWGFDIDDPRLNEMLDDYPQREVPVFVRPWIDAKTVPGINPHTETRGAFPREWRVFVHDGMVKGVSTYYPQAPLPESDDDHAHAITADLVDRTNAIVDVLRRHAAQPYHPYLDNARQEDARGITMTLDFLEPADNGPPMFLEGGPPSLPFWGAHPCCFTDAAEIDGIALGDGRFLDWPRTPEPGR